MAKITNRQRLLDKMAAIPKAVRAEIRKALEQSAQEIVAAQKRLAPVDSGDLQRSIGYTFGNYRPDNANVRGVVSSGGARDPDLSVTIHAGDAKAYYAAFVEFGTGAAEAGGKFKGAYIPPRMPQPFFFPAYRALRKRVRSRVSRATTKAVRQVAR